MKSIGKFKRKGGTKHSESGKSRENVRKEESNQPFILRIDQKERFTEWKDAITMEIKINLGDSGRLLDIDKSRFLQHKR